MHIVNAEGNNAAFLTVKRVVEQFQDINPLLGCPRKLGSMVSKWVITYLQMGYIGVITLLLTIY